MEERKIHYNLKPLLANLNRLANFKDYLESSEFHNILLEYGYDELWEKNISYTGIFGRQEVNKTYVNCLNFMLLIWLDSNGDELVTKKINEFLTFTISGYIEFNEIKKDFSKLINSLDFGPDTKATQDKINRLLSSKVYEETVMNKNEIEEVTQSVEIDYAIITALEDDEMEKILPLIVKEGEVEDSNNYIEYGYLRDKPSKKIVYASQHNTGMVDASILASELIIKFKPKFLIMIGVLGGKPADTSIGDVIIANKVFEIDRGKLTDVGFKKEASVANLKSREIIKINRKKREIEEFIKGVDETRKSHVQLHFGPIACVNQVIDVEDFFQEKITTVDRKAIALEMESFAIVRACELLNNGETKPLIIKSVMDNTQDKTDEGKTYAAWTSAKTLEFILLNDII